MRADEFTKPKQEQQVVEVVPAIAAAVGRVGASMGTAAAKAGMKVATAGMKAGAKAGANLAKGAGKAAMKSIGKAQANISKSILKKGAKLAMPTQGPGGREQEFDIDDYTYSSSAPSFKLSNSLHDNYIDHKMNLKESNLKSSSSSDNINYHNMIGTSPDQATTSMFGYYYNKLFTSNTSNT